MTTITLTREFSGFVNVSDNWLVGSDDSKAGTIKDYVLPEGFTLGRAFGGEIAIFGPDGYKCEIVTHRPSGHPQLLWGERNPVLSVANA